MFEEKFQNRPTTLRLFHTVTLCYTFEGSKHVAQSILEHRIKKSRMVIGKHYFLLACWLSSHVRNSISTTSITIENSEILHSEANL